MKPRVFVYSNTMISILVSIVFTYKGFTQVTEDIKSGINAFGNGTISVPVSRTGGDVNYGCPEIGPLPWLDGGHYVQVDFTVPVAEFSYVYWGADVGDTIEILVNGAPFNLSPSINTCPAPGYACSDWTNCGNPVYSGNRMINPGPNSYILTISGVPGGVSSFRATQIANTSGHGAGKIIYVLDTPTCLAGADVVQF